ncbi:MAG TPA: xanthine dehydrogenase family protein subunit M [Rhizomicrobium sp.]|nr:xanthine dehydrogenase family protein subunit M [Rhizomicrobium sp.]
MIPYQFEYTRAKSLGDAQAMLAKNPDAKLLAGGQTLIPTMKMRLANPPTLIDISKLAELSFIRASGDTLTIGAATTHGAVAASADVRRLIPALAHLASEIGDPAVRAMGTIGGSLANNDPAADYPAAVLALGATIKTTKREIKADDFFTGMFSTALEDGEIITEVSFRKPQRAGYQKFPNPASRYPMAGVFVAQTAGGVRVAVTGAGPGVFRVEAMEAALAKSFTPDAVANIKVPSGDLNSDIHATAEYRAHLVTVMAKRAVAHALEA